MTAGAGDLACSELVALITEYLEGALPDQERALFDEHLRECFGCERYLGQMRQTVRLVGTLTEEALPPETRAALLRLFRDWKRRRAALALGG